MKESKGDNRPGDGFGYAVQVVKVSEDRKFELDVEALSAILLQQSIRDTPVVVVSIAGDLRKGKSFLLNFFLRYLHSGCDASCDWLGDDYTPLKGFSWSGGCERNTTGILMWSEPFIVKVDNDKEVAIILMDTQGVWDSESTVRDSVTIFALSNMISSIQVFNLIHNLQEDNLQVLEMFTEYGKLVIDNTHDKPFQKLLFLIRDWSSPDDFPYGLEGGQRFLQKKLECKNNQPNQLKSLRQNIKSCFSEINCFLMPYPGRDVATVKHFDGRLSEIDPDFTKQLRLLVLSLFDPNNLVVKEIGGKQVNGKELFEYFKAYFNVFAGQTLPEPKSIFEAIADANNLIALAAAKDCYLIAMDNVCGGNRPFIQPETLGKKHITLRDEALKMFDNFKKIGGQEYSIVYRDNLCLDLDSAFKRFEAQNNSKKRFYHYLKSFYNHPKEWSIASLTFLLASAGCAEFALSNLFLCCSEVIIVSAFICLIYKKSINLLYGTDSSFADNNVGSTVKVLIT